jgi:hypothetical protein
MKIAMIMVKIGIPMSGTVQTHGKRDFSIILAICGFDLCFVFFFVFLKTIQTFSEMLLL